MLKLKVRYSYVGIKCYFVLDKPLAIMNGSIENDYFDDNPFHAPVKKLHTLEEKEIQANEFL